MIILRLTPLLRVLAFGLSLGLSSLLQADVPEATITSPSIGITVGRGQVVTFSATSDDSVGYDGYTVNGFNWDFGDGTTDGGASTAHAYASEGWRTITLRVSYRVIVVPGTPLRPRSISLTKTATATRTLLVLAPPTISSFFANSASVKGGSSVTLSWSTANATALFVSGVGSVSGTSVVVYPASSTTYILTASNEGGTASATVSVMTYTVGERKWTPKWTKDIVYLGTKEVAEVDPDGAHVTLVDHLGTPRFEVRANQSVVEQKFAPFGESLTDPTAAGKFAKGFTNHEQTDPSCLIYMQARFYLPMYGRFASPDPGRDQHFEMTQSWNIYSYVQNNPVTHTDPTGMFDPDIHEEITRLAAGSAGIKNSSFLADVISWTNTTDAMNWNTPAQHFDGLRSQAQINSNFTGYVNSEISKGSIEGISNGLHAIQDFYSHSNYVEIYLSIHPDSKPGDIPVYTDAIKGDDSKLKGALAKDLHTGTFELKEKAVGSKDPGSHYKMNKDNDKASANGKKATNGTNLHKYAKDLAVRESAKFLKKNKDEINKVN